LIAGIYLYSQTNASDVAKRHLAVALHLLATDKDCAREHAILHEWISSWLGDIHNDAFNKLHASISDYLPKGDEAPSQTPPVLDASLETIIRMVKDDLEKGYSHRTIAADMTMRAAALLGRVDSVRDRSLSHVSRSVRRQATKRTERTARTPSVERGRR